MVRATDAMTMMARMMVNAATITPVTVMLSAGELPEMPATRGGSRGVASRS